MALMSPGVYITDNDVTSFYPHMIAKAGYVDEVGETYNIDNVVEYYWVMLRERITPSGYTSIHHYEVEAWTTQTFGPRANWGTIKNGERWLASNRKYYFVHEQDRTLFLMKWS